VNLQPSSHSHSGSSSFRRLLPPRTRAAGARRVHQTARLRLECVLLAVFAHHRHRATAILGKILPLCISIWQNPTKALHHQVRLDASGVER
jgi:hypothetical protein